MSHPSDRTQELSFERGDPRIVDNLLENRLALVKAVLTDAELDGVAQAYRTRRALVAHRRLALRAVTGLGFDESSAVFQAIRPASIEADPRRLPLSLRTARAAVNKVMAVNDELFRDTRLQDVYGGNRPLTVATFPASFPHVSDNEGFPLHQDSIGVTGLGYGVQPLPTTWEVYAWAPTLPLDVAYNFETERGDLVVLTERVGPCPNAIPRLQGRELFVEDGSEIHRGINETGLRRYGLGMFHQELAELGKA